LSCTTTDTRQLWCAVYPQKPRVGCCALSNLGRKKTSVFWAGCIKLRVIPWIEWVGREVAKRVMYGAGHR